MESGTSDSKGKDSYANRSNSEKGEVDTEGETDTTMHLKALEAIGKKDKTPGRTPRQVFKEEQRANAA